MSRCISGSVMRQVVPAAETTFSSIISEPKSLAPKRSATWPIFGPMVTHDAWILGTLSSTMRAIPWVRRYVTASVLPRCSSSVCSGCSGQQMKAVKPPVRACLLPRHAVADVLDEDLPAPAGDGVEPGRHELPDHLFDRHPEAAREEIHLRRGEAVDVDRMVALDVPHQVQVPLERDVGVVPPLHQDLYTAERFELVDLAPDLLEREHVAFGVLGSPVERAELAVGHADVSVIDVPVDDVGDHVLGVQAPARLVRETAQLEQRGALVQLQVRPELGPGAVYHGHATSR